MANEASKDAEIVLRIWPSLWDLPSFTPDCIAAVLYLQHTLPGKFIVEECTNPDLSPNGTFPYVVYGEACVASFANIVKYVDGIIKPASSLAEDEEEIGSTTASHERQSSKEKSQQTAWIAFVFANLGDLVACSLFTLRHNYHDFTRPALADLFPLPLRYYVPDRIRETYKLRLESADLWAIHAEEVEEERRVMTAEAQIRAAREKGGVAQESTVKEAFGKEKVLEKARETLSILSNLLGSKHTFFTSSSGHTPLTTLDIVVAAHVLLLTSPAFPNTLISTLIRETYPSLHAHGLRVYAALLPQNVQSPSASLSSSYELLSDAQTPPPPLQIRRAPTASFSQAITSVLLPFPFKLPTFSSMKGRSRGEKDSEFDQMRWAWYGLAAMGVVGWIWATGIRIIIVTQSDDDEDERLEVDVGEEEEEGSEEEE